MNTQKAEELLFGNFNYLDFIEKASRRAVGEAHPNGKWVWTDLGNGKYNWRVPKGKGAAAGSSDDSNKKKEENADGKGENIDNKEKVSNVKNKSIVNRLKADGYVSDYDNIDIKDVKSQMQLLGKGKISSKYNVQRELGSIFGDDNVSVIKDQKNSTYSKRLYKIRGLGVLSVGVGLVAAEVKWINNQGKTFDVAIGSDVNYPLSWNYKGIQQSLLDNGKVK